MVVEVAETVADGVLGKDDICGNVVGVKRKS
jgi:hypothetical protein